MEQEQLTLNLPKPKKDMRLTIQVDHADKKALEQGMAKVGETNASSYIRRLIHANK
jgi:hypothetical protein